MQPSSYSWLAFGAIIGLVWRALPVLAVASVFFGLLRLMGA